MVRQPGIPEQLEQSWQGHPYKIERSAHPTSDPVQHHTLHFRESLEMLRIVY